MKPHTFVFFGIVGSGKGTQVELLQKYLQEKDTASETLLISTGAVFRKLVASDSYTGSLIKERLEKGFLQPDFLTISLASQVLINGLTESMHIIADAYPRTIAQSQALEAAMEFYKRSNIAIIYIEVGKEEAIRRMKLRGRSDDTDEGIAQRFDEYVNNVIPSFEYFKGKEGYTTYRINGEQSVEDVHKELIAQIGI